MPAGLQQKVLWQHQVAKLIDEGQSSLDGLDEQLMRYDLLATARERMEVSYTAMEDSLNSIRALLEEYGLAGQTNPAFNNAPVDDLSEYYHHILRDWAWDDYDSPWFETHANDANLKRTLATLPSNAQVNQLLVLGSGAGRLSWDLHKYFKPEFTLASDLNPLLLAASERLVKKQQALFLPELCTYPQIGYPHAKNWQMQPPEDANNLRDSWFALGADVWNMPIKPNSVDTIVTSWLLDVTGGDVRDLIGVIHYLLKPEGLWINTGPLLYSRSLPFDQKYNADEIKQLAELADFNFINENVEEVPHLASPTNARFHHEQVWSFCAQLKPEEQKPIPKPSNTPEWLTPPWLIIHHLPVPKINFQCEQNHEFVQMVLSLVDGERSIHAISQLVQTNMPPGVLAKDAVVALFGEILVGMAENH